MGEGFRLEPRDAESIIRHMNEDHSDALLNYARAFAGEGAASAAQMLDIDARRMVLIADVDGAKKTLTIEFDQPLTSPGDARRVLVAMAKRART